MSAASPTASGVDFEAVSEGVLDAIRPVVEREMKEAANQLYGATLEAVQDYLSDNASFNIRSRLDAAERERRSQWERADALALANAELVLALENASFALQRLHTDVEALMADSGGVYGLHSNGDHAPWEELREGGQFEDWLGTPLWATRNAWSDARAAIAKATGEAS